MTDGKFTAKDAENDGLIKREVGREMAKVARTNSQQLFEYFEQVCDHEGRDPWKVLGDGVVRALNDETVAESVAAIDIDMSKVDGGRTRVEDAKFVKELASELGLEQDSGHWIEETVRDRIKSKTESPIPTLEGGQQGAGDPELRRELQEVKSQMNELMGAMDGETQSSSSEGKDVDDLFDGVGSDDGGEESESDSVDGSDDDGSETQVDEGGGESDGGEPDLEDLQVDIAEDVDSRGVEGKEESELPSSTDGERGNKP